MDGSCATALPTPIPVLRSVTRPQPVRAMPPTLAAEPGPIARFYECTRCGSRAVAHSATNRCPMCGSTRLHERCGGGRGLPPHHRRPFVLDRRAATAAMRRWIAARWLAPLGWAHDLRARPLVDVYLPCWALRAQTATEYRGLRGEDRPDPSTRSGSRWVRRGRRSTRTRWRPAQGSVAVRFDGLLVCGSRSLPERLLRRLIPRTVPAPSRRDRNGSVDASWVEHSAVERSEGLRMAHAEVDREIRGAVREDIGGDRQRIHDLHTQHHGSRLDRILWPVWVGTYRHRGQLRRVLVDGSTGRVIGERPLSIPRIAAVVGLMALMLVWLFA